MFNHQVMAISALRKINHYMIEQRHVRVRNQVLVLPTAYFQRVYKWHIESVPKFVREIAILSPDVFANLLYM